MMAWVKVGTSNYNPIFSSSQHPSSYHGFWMNCGPSRVTGAFGDGTGGFTPAARNSKFANLSFTFNPNEWYHICVVIRGAGDMDIYVNGIDVGGSYSGSASSMVNNPSGDANIGYHRRQTQEFYEGTIDELKVFDAGLSATEVRTEMCRKADPNNPNLLGAWDFNEPFNAPQFDDLSTNGNDGNRSGGALSVISGAAVGDTSVFIYPLTINGTLDLGLSNIDMVSLSVASTVDGMQLYRVDNLPVDQDSIQVAPGINHYYGAYSTGAGDLYQLDYLAQPGFYQANTYKVAYRKQNDSPYWTEFNGFLSPSYSSSPNRVHREEYVLVGEPPCTGPSQLPAFYTDCDSLVISLPATFNNPQWSDGSTASNRTFYQNGSFIITGTDDNGCLISDTIAIQVNTAGFSPIPDQDFCDSITINLDPNLQAVQWFDGSLNRQRQFFTAGTYWYRAQDPLNGCAFSDTFELSLSSNGVVWNEVFSDLDVFCLGDTIKLFPPQGTQIVWPNSSDSSFTVYGPSTITVDLSAGCSDTTLSIDVDFTDCDCRVHIPNAFTPNGDGLNEKFRPQSACEFLSYHLIIFNRWGIKVFETSDPQQAFDGTYRGQPVPQSSLVYQLTYTSARTQRSVQGIVNLLR